MPPKKEKPVKGDIKAAKNASLIARVSDVEGAYIHPESKKDLGSFGAHDVKEGRAPRNWFLKDDPDGDNRPTLPDGRRYSIGNPDDEKPVESLESRRVKEWLQIGLERREKEFWKSALEIEKFNEEGIFKIESEKLTDCPPDLLFSPLHRKSLNYLYGKKADWRVALCVLARSEPIARGILASCLSKAAATANTAEMNAFSKAVKLIRNHANKGPIGSGMAESQLPAMYFVWTTAKSTLSSQSG